MKLHRFIGDFDLSEKKIILESSDITHQLTHVLRVKPGTEIILCNGKGKEAQVILETIEKNKIFVERKELFESTPESSRQVVLYAALIKGEHFEFIAEKATEVGVAEIIPIITNRTIKLKVKMERIEKIMKEAAEQSGRGRIPLLGEVLSFKEALEHSQKNEKNIFFDLHSTPFTPKLLGKSVSLGAFVGPEGGFDESEREQAEKKGHLVTHISQFTFRAETAAIVSSYLLCQS